MKQKSIYERYSIKQKINVTRQSEIMQTLNLELEKSRELSLQLNQIAKQTEIKPGETNAVFLRSSCWYGNKVQEQLETAKNRNAFLEKEVADSRKLLAKAVNKKNKSISVDFSGTTPQLASNYNAPEPVTKAVYTLSVPFAKLAKVIPPILEVLSWFPDVPFVICENVMFAADTDAVIVALHVEVPSTTVAAIF